VFTRPAPKSAKAQVEFLCTRAKQSTKVLAEQLGVSPRTVQRYRAGQQTRPQKKLRAALMEEAESQWQPQVRAQARERAATTSGMQMEVYAYFGFACTGSSDDGRERFRWAAPARVVALSFAGRPVGSPRASLAVRAPAARSSM
jgi:transcriptional regulator with XRE-family HTH domain